MLREIASPAPDDNVRALLEDLTAELPEIVSLAVAVEYRAGYRTRLAGHISLMTIGAAAQLLRYAQDVKLEEEDASE
jgi:hypothetical protein